MTSNILKYVKLSFNLIPLMTVIHGTGGLVSLPLATECTSLSLDVALAL